MRAYLIIGFVILVIQLIAFGILLVGKLSHFGPFPDLSWWLVCAPLYLPCMLSLVLLVLAWILNTEYKKTLDYGQESY
jgi:hypothetical protein